VPLWQKKVEKSFMNRKIGSIVIIVFSLLVLELLYLSFGANRQAELDSGHHLVMGTFARVVAIAKDSGTAKKCIRAALVEIREVDERMSDYKDDSEVSELNRDGSRRCGFVPFRRRRSSRPEQRANRPGQIQSGLREAKTQQSK
jgi:hypothetical protein